MQARFLEKRNPWSRLLHFSPRLLLSRNPIEKVKKNSEKEGEQNSDAATRSRESGKILPKKRSVVFFSSFVTRSHQFLSRLCEYFSIFYISYLFLLHL